MKSFLSKILFALSLVFVTNLEFTHAKSSTGFPVDAKNPILQALVIPVGTTINLKSKNEIQTASLKGGDSFFVELASDIAMKGKVVLPKGTPVQMEVIYSKSDKNNRNIFNVTVGGFVINNYLHKVRTENKIIAVDGPPGQGPSKVKLTTSSGNSAGVLEEGTSIVFPAGTTATFKLANSLNVSW